MTPPLVLIVAYQCDDLLAQCLRALGPHEPVVVVDNSPHEVTRATVGDSAAYVPAPENLGFAAGVNLGLATAWDGVRDVLLLNPDARMTSAQVHALQRGLRDRGPRCAAVGPRLQHPDGTPEPCTWPVPSPSQVWMDAVGLGRFAGGQRFVNGAALMLSGTALAELGGLDERYFLYAEEADWQMRALAAGWTVGVLDSLVITHIGGASSTDPAARARHFHRSGRIFAERWYPGAGARAMRLGRILAACRRWLTQPATRIEQRQLLAISLAHRVEDIR